MKLVLTIKQELKESRNVIAVVGNTVDAKIISIIRNLNLLKLINITIASFYAENRKYIERKKINEEEIVLDIKNIEYSFFNIRTLKNSYECMEKISKDINFKLSFDSKITNLYLFLSNVPYWYSKKKVKNILNINSFVIFKKIGNFSFKKIKNYILTSYNEQVNNYGVFLYLGNYLNHKRTFIDYKGRIKKTKIVIKTNRNYEGILFVLFLSFNLNLEEEQEEIKEEIEEEQEKREEEQEEIEEEQEDLFEKKKKEELLIKGLYRNPLTYIINKFFYWKKKKLYRFKNKKKDFISKDEIKEVIDRVINDINKSYDINNKKKIDSSILEDEEINKIYINILINIEPDVISLENNYKEEFKYGLFIEIINNHIKTLLYFEILERIEEKLKKLKK